MIWTAVFLFFFFGFQCRAADLNLSKAFGGQVHLLSPEQLFEISSGLTVSGVDAARDWQGTMWAVRFATLPESDSRPDTDAKAFEEAAAVVSPAICRFGVVHLSTPAAFALIDLLQINIPEIRLFNSEKTRPPGFDKGLFVSDRLYAKKKMLDHTSKQGFTRNEIVSFIYYNIPRFFIDESQVSHQTVVHTGSKKQTVQYAAAARKHFNSNPFHVCVIHMSAVSHICMDTMAATFSAAAIAQRRGGSTVFFCEARIGSTFEDWSPASEESKKFQSSGITEKFPFNAPVSLVKFRLEIDTDNVDTTSLEIKHFVYDPSDVLDFVLKAAEASLPLSLEQQQRTANEGWIRSSISKLLSPSGPSHSPLRRLHQRAHFLHDLIPLKAGVGVIFWLRESDRGFPGHLKVAKKVAEEFATNFEATIQDKITQMHFSVFMVEAERQKDAAKAIGVTQVPSVCVVLPLQDGKKGIKFLKHPTKDFPSAKVIGKFIRETAFDGKEVVPRDSLSDIPWADEPDLQVFEDQQQKTEYLYLDPRQFPDQYESSENNLLRDIVKMHLPIKGIIVEEEQKKQGEGDKKKREEESKKKDKMEKKKKAKKEAEKKELEEQLEKKKREKEERMKAKAAEAEKKAEMRRKDLEERQKKQAERQAREELDGTSERRRIAKQKAEERRKVLEEAQKKAKSRRAKSSVALEREWSTDVMNAVQTYLIEKEDGEGEVLDVIL